MSQTQPQQSQESRQRYRKHRPAMPPAAYMKLIELKIRLGNPKGWTKFVNMLYSIVEEYEVLKRRCEELERERDALRAEVERLRAELDNLQRKLKEMRRRVLL